MVTGVSRSPTAPVTETSPWTEADAAGAVSPPAAEPAEPAGLDEPAVEPDEWLAGPWPGAVPPEEPEPTGALLAEPPPAGPEPAGELPPDEPPLAGAEPELRPESGAGALVCVAGATCEVTAVTAWLAADVTGAAAWVTVVAAWDTADEAWLTAELTGAADDEEDAAGVLGTLAAEAGWVTPDTTPLTVPVTPLTTPEAVPVTEPSRLPTGSGVDDAGTAVAVRLVVAA
jgi:hypothetical protein